MTKKNELNSLLNAVSDSKVNLYNNVADYIRNGSQDEYEIMEGCRFLHSIDDCDRLFILDKIACDENEFIIVHDMVRDEWLLASGFIDVFDEIAKKIVWNDEEEISPLIPVFRELLALRGIDTSDYGDYELQCALQQIEDEMFESLKGFFE